MPFPLAIPVAISAIQALIKFRAQLDTILSLSEATDPLPFAEPPAPNFDAKYIDVMVAFFNSEEGRGVLAIRGQEADWAALTPDPRAFEVQPQLFRLLALYYEVQGFPPETLGPTLPHFAGTGPDRDLRLAYCIVESHRLSRNPVVTRVLLAAADALLEFGGANAGLFVTNPRWRGLLETLLTEFSSGPDWSDASAGTLFKRLLGAAASAVAAHRGELPDRPVLNVLFAALADVKTQMGDNFVADLVSRGGLEQLASRLLLRTADAPGLLPNAPILRETLKAMLLEAGNHLDTMFEDPRSLVRVLEAGLAVAAEAAVPFLDRKLDGTPLLAVVLRAALVEIQHAAAAHALFGQLGNGELISAIYQAALRSVAASPELLTDRLKLDPFVARLVTAVADQLAQQPLADALSPGTLRSLTIRSLEVLAGEPEFLVRHQAFAAQVLGATLAATAAACKDGLTQEDLLEVATAAVRAATGNLGLVPLGDRWQTVLAGIGTVLTHADLAPLTTAKGRKALFFAALEAVAANPKVWDGLAQRQLVQPLVVAVIQALATDPTHLLSGPALVPALRQVLLAAARAGARLTGQVDVDHLRLLLILALAHAGKAVGQSLDGETLPDYLERVVQRFLLAPFDPADANLAQPFLELRLPLDWDLLAAALPPATISARDGTPARRQTLRPSQRRTRTKPQRPPQPRSRPRGGSP